MMNKEKVFVVRFAVILASLNVVGCHSSFRYEFINTSNSTVDFKECSDNITTSINGRGGNMFYESNGLSKICFELSSSKGVNGKYEFTSYELEDASNKGAVIFRITDEGVELDQPKERNWTSSSSEKE